MKKMWALVLAVLMVSLNMMAVAEEAGAEPFELKEYHMNLERFRGEPDNMIDSDGNIIFGNAASNKSKTGKNIMLMSYSEEKTLIGDNTAPLCFLLSARVSGQAAYMLKRIMQIIGFNCQVFLGSIMSDFLLLILRREQCSRFAASKRVSMTFSGDYGDKCSYKLTKEQYHQLGLICDEYDEVLEPYWKQLREIADNAGLKKELYNVAWSEVRAKVSVS